MDSYQKLLTKYREIKVLDTISGIMTWDMETYIPPRGIQQRGEQLALLQQLIHRMMTSRELSSLLNQAEKSSTSDTLDSIQQRNLYLIRKEYEEATKLPEELVAEIAKQQAITIDVWKKAKAAKDWKMFQPEFTKMLNLIKQKAEILMEVKEVSNPYDAVLDTFEPGTTSDQIDQVFTELRGDLVPLIDKYVEVTENVDRTFLQQTIPISVQRTIITDMATLIGYDISSDKAGGRIDETEHPFTVGYYDDVRVTVHYYEKNLASAIFAALHEIGHALYDQNMNPEWLFQPVGDPQSFGIHESQSRFIENIVGRSREFWQLYLPRLNKLTNGAFTKVGVADFSSAINQVKRSKIRIQADEVTYSLHIIVRFDIERALFADKIEVSELPRIWNDKYDEYLAVKIDHDSEGVMQDTHWAQGYYGYFPSYALGNIYGGQLLETMEHQIPDWRAQMAKGDIQPVIQWLTEKVHRTGGLYDPVDQIRHITSKSPSAKPFLTYLHRKLSQLFGV